MSTDTSISRATAACVATTSPTPVADPGTLGACLECRQRHLKCDGRRPCKRCVDSDSTCIFVPSRRGQRSQIRGCSQSIAAQETGSSLGIKRTQQDAGFRASDCHRKSAFRGATSPPGLGSLVAWSKSAPRPASAAGPPQQCRLHPAVSFERCISSYYHHFHPSHPLVLPQQHLLPRVKEEALQPLLAVMHWVGSKYIAPETDQQLLLDMARLAVDEAETNRANGFTVQAMMVLLVALDGTGYPQQAVELLLRTKQMALSLGINYNQFMTESKPRCRVLDESWRRTWWELYVLDGMFAGAHRATAFSLLDVPTDVGLPCEEDEYETDQIPEPCTLEDLSDRDLNMKSCDFSSFSYRVLSVQNLGKVLQHYEAAEVDAHVHAQLEVVLSSWRHNLPASKRDSLQRDGRPDEMMFQAHMLNHTTSILLHRSRAQLDLAPARTIDACAPTAVASTPESKDAAAAAHPRVSLHARHVAAAANEIGKLMTHRTRLTLHTHFFICAVVLAAIVQLGAWSGGDSDDDDAVREQVRLCIGALRQMASVWGVAKKALGQVREVAGHVHFARTQSREMEQFLVNVTEEDMMSMFAADALLGDMEAV